MPDDVVSLESFISKENELYKQDLESLSRILEADILFTQANRSLTGKGYFIESINILPVSNESGTFRYEYRAWTRLPAVMSGSDREDRSLICQMSGLVEISSSGSYERNVTSVEYR